MDSARNFLDNLPPPAECLAILVGCAQLTVFGLAALANPVEFAKGYGLPISPASVSQEHTSNAILSDEESKSEDRIQKTQEGLVAAIAGRNITNGVLILTLACYTRNRRALGIAIAANAVTTLVDALVVKYKGVESQVFGHATGVFNSAAIGYSLLHWARDDPWW